ncbi:MAG: ABC transporter permease [Betaproteobacteria bacterium]
MGESSAGASAASAGRALGNFLARFGLVIALIAMEIGFAIVEPLVLSPGNLLNVLQQTSYIAVFATAQMVVILTRGFDLSLGTCVSTVSVASALVMTGMVGDGLHGMPFIILTGMLTALGIGVAVGLFNGICISVLRVNAFVTTLGSLNICFGIATTISDGRPVFDVPKPFSHLLYSGKILGVPAPVIIAILVLLAVHLMLTWTVFGRSLYLIGGNPRAAALAGLPSKRYLTSAYVVCSVIAAIGALMLTARTGSGEPNLGGNVTLQSIAAAVIGGVSLRGGVGGTYAALLGAVFVTALSNCMGLARIDGYIQQIILGCVIIAAIFVDRLRTGVR